MKKLLIFTLILSFVFSTATLAAERFKSGEIIVKLKDFPALSNGSLSISSLNDVFNTLKVNKIEKLFRGNIKTSAISGSDELDKYIKLSVPKNTDILKAVEELKKYPQVEAAGPNYTVHAFAITPNDPQFNLQWGLSKILAPDAWGFTTGTTFEIIAVIDTGVDYAHEDLAGKVILGYDYVNDDADPTDDNGHGTMVSGVISAITNNSKGVAGVDWNAKILAYKVLDSDGSGYEDKAAEAIRAAVDDYHANVINMSFGSTEIDLTGALESACDYAYGKGAVLVAAAGNDGIATPTYPAYYSSVMAVAATDKNDLRSIWNSSESSNYGNWVAVSAPGTDIMTTAYNPHDPGNNSDYEYESGTSLATPFVSGLAGLILAQNPTYNNATVITTIKNTADNIDALNPSYAGKLGTGRINAAKALGAPIAKISSPTASQTVSGTLEISGTAGGGSFKKYKVEWGAGASPTTWNLIGGEHTSAVINNVLEKWQTYPGSNGAYTIKLTVTGSGEATDSVHITLNNTLRILGDIKYGPNPFSPAKGGNYLFQYTMTTDANVTLFIFDLSGKLIDQQNFSQMGGTHSITWNGRNMFNEPCQNGVYLFKISVNNNIIGQGKILIIN